ncbi:MAG: sulfite exporter TauE/SafE family protein [Phycisphaerales bacterium]|nr:sulfite exporter TauE/SafE family protein [Phycisphaerales bacterium]
MFEDQTLVLSLAVLVMAGLYSTVGHGGGSGYLAVLALSGIAPEQMRPTALLLNVVVATIGTWKFGKTGTFRKDIFVPLILASIPAAFIGGSIEISQNVYKPVVGVVLLYAAARLFIPIKGIEKTKHPQTILIIIAGLVIGFGSGIIGVGGGIFLSPLLLLLGWSTAKQTAAISAPFILVNSVAGLGGIATDFGSVPIDMEFVLPLAIAVVVGGMLGASFGSKKLGHQGLRTILGVVLLTASIKMFMTTSTVQNGPLPVDVKSTQ